MATAHPNQPKKQDPPKAGQRPSVRIDDQLAADLAVLMSTGDNFSDVVRQAVGQRADMCRTAWAEGVVPVGTAPTLLAYQLEQDPNMMPTLPTPAPAPTSAYDARRQPSPLPGGHPAASVARPSTPAPGRGPQQRRPGPYRGVPVRHVNQAV
ncbi:hypothetical protein [Streptomyces sp. NPDC021622]|uniref:hypothetical protein n=1 Tax=Streptomyces sp. NPDC021622 TaxID=3155013 RepID=UPI0033FD563E